MDFEGWQRRMEGARGKLAGGRKRAATTAGQRRDKAGATCGSLKAYSK